MVLVTNINAMLAGRDLVGISVLFIGELGWTLLGEGSHSFLAIGLKNKGKLIKK